MAKSVVQSVLVLYDQIRRLRAEIENRRNRRDAKALEEIELLSSTLAKRERQLNEIDLRVEALRKGGTSPNQ